MMHKEKRVVHDFNSQIDREKGVNQVNKWSIAFILSMVVFGVLTGYALAKRSATPTTEGEKGEGLIVKTEKVVGSQDKKTFKDSAEGVLEKGGIDGEGTHHLIRDEERLDQTAYLTSSVVDLDEFIGREVRVWGETFEAEKAGWLMDVGRVELIGSLE